MLTAAQAACDATLPQWQLRSTLLACLPLWLRWASLYNSRASRFLIDAFFRIKIHGTTRGASLSAAGVQTVDATNPIHVVSCLHPDRATRLNASKLARKLDVNLTDVCNLKCGYCYQRSRDTDWVENGQFNTSDNLSTKRIIELIDEGYMIGARVLKLTGGEPFARKDIFEILRAASSHQFEYVEICTNFKIINEKKIEALVEIFSGGHAPPLHLHISIDGYSEDKIAANSKTEKIFGPDDFRRIHYLKSKIPRMTYSINSMWVNSLVENDAYLRIFEYLVHCVPTRWSLSFPYLVKDAVAPIYDGIALYPTFDHIIAVTKRLIESRAEIMPNFPISIPLVYQSPLTITTRKRTHDETLNHPCFPCHGSFFIIGPNGQNFDCLLLSDTDQNVRDNGLEALIFDRRLYNEWWSLKTPDVISECHGCRYLSLCGGQCPNDRWNGSGGVHFGRDKSACSLLARAERTIWPILPDNERIALAEEIDTTGFIPATYKSLDSIVIGDSPSTPDILASGETIDRASHAAPVRVQYRMKQ